MLLKKHTFQKKNSEIAQLLSDYNCTTRFVNRQRRLLELNDKYFLLLGRAICIVLDTNSYLLGKHPAIICSECKYYINCIWHWPPLTTVHNEKITKSKHLAFNVLLLVWETGAVLLRQLSFHEANYDRESLGLCKIFLMILAIGKYWRQW